MKTITCPQCGGPSLWDESNKARPFCCDRCKLIDLGAWASESYQIPVQPSDEAYEDYSSGYDASGLSTNATKH